VFADPFRVQRDACLCFFFFPFDITVRQAGLRCRLFFQRQAAIRAWFGTNSRQSRMTSGVHACSAVCPAKLEVAAKHVTTPRSKPATIVEDGKNRFKRK
jgi:hypothetical protein